MLTENKVTELFCIADDFCKFFDAMMGKYTLKPDRKRHYHRDSTMSKAEIMLIMILFHDSGYRYLKHFYHAGIFAIFSRGLSRTTALWNLRKRTVIETINNELKNIAQVEHSRHRSFDNFIVNTLGALAAYCCFPKKPAIAVERA